MYHDFRRKEKSYSTVLHFQLKCTKHDSFQASTTNFWNCKICFLLCWHLLCYSSWNNHAYSTPLYESVALKSCPNKISNAACDHPSSHFRNDHFYRHRHAFLSVVYYPVLQPCFQVRPFCNTCTHYSSHFRNDHFYRKRHSVVSVACYAVLQPCFQVRPFCNMCTLLFSNFCDSFPHSHTMFSVTGGHNTFQLSYYHALSHTLPPLIRNKQ